MEKDFLLEDEFREYPRKRNMPYKDFDACMSGLRGLFVNCEDIPEDIYEKEYFFYVPSLMASNHKDLAMKLLACTYADILPTAKSQNISFFKRYCKFIRNVQIDNNIIEPLDEDTLKSIREYLQNREVWICDPDFSRIFRAKNTDKTLWQLFRIRVLSWNRQYFPLDFIKKHLDTIEPNIIDEWVDKTIRNISVLTKSDAGVFKELAFSKILLFDFHWNKEFHAFDVDVISKASHNSEDDRFERLTLMTPTAHDKPKKMQVKGLRDISIDHLIPLELIVRQISKNNQTTLSLIIDAFENNPDEAEKVFDEISLKTLKGEFDRIREDAHCRLMDKKENSIKSNNTPYIKYNKKRKGVYEFIIAENVRNPCDNLEYTIIQTLDNNQFRSVEMRKTPRLRLRGNEK